MIRSLSRKASRALLPIGLVAASLFGFAPGTPTASAAEPTYGAQRTVVGPSFDSPYGSVVDASGNIYVSDGSHGRVVKYQFGGGGQTVVATGLSAPSGLAVDAAGNLYIADWGNNRIVKVTTAGVQATVVLANGYTLNRPDGVAVDTAGNLFIADTGHNAILKVAAPGGLSKSFFNNLQSPQGVAVDAAGDVYVADTNNRRIVKFNGTTGAPTIVPTPGFTLTDPYAVAVDAANNVYITDTFANPPRIVKISGANGAATIVATSPLNAPQGIAVDTAGAIYVSDTFNGRVIKVTSDGTETTINNVGVASPYAVTVGAANNVYIADSASTIVKVPSGGARTILPTTGLNGPSGTAVDSADNLYVADTNNNRIVRISAANGAQTNVTTTGVTLNHPRGLAVDTANNLYIADTGANRIDKVTSGGSASTLSTTGLSPGLSSPSGVAVDATNNLYIADTNNNRIVKITSGGTGAKSIVTTTGLSPGLNRPNGIAVDATNNLYIADTNNNRIVKINGTTGAPTIVSTTGLSAPTSVAVDAANNIYIADTNNTRVVEEPVLLTLTASPISGSTNTTTPFAGQLTTTGATGPVTWVKTAGSASVVVSSAGAMTTTSPLAAGNYAASGTMSDPVGDTGTWSFTLTVTPKVLSSTPTSGSTQAATAFAGQLATTGGSGTVAYAQSTGTPAVTVNSSGAISAAGTLTVGNRTATGTTTDPFGNTGTWSFTLTVTARVLSSTPTSGSVLAGSVFAGQLATTGGSGTVAYAQSAGSPSVTVNSSGAISAAGTLAVGSYTAAGTTTDPLGDAGTWSFALTVTDSTAPNTTIDSSTPATSPSTLTTASYGFSGTDDITTAANLAFKCSLDGATATACTSPTSYASLAAGVHTFTVSATDQAGNADASPASRTWTVDTTAPDTAIDSSTPATSPSTLTTASYSFSGTDDVSSPAHLTFACSLDGATATACASPASYASLAAGSHTFTVSATDQAGNADAAPASRTWTVDLTAPDTSITSGPNGYTPSTSVLFSLTGTDNVTPTANLTFRCSLDGATATTCTSHPSYSGLAEGFHLLSVAAVDQAGNVDASPALRPWTVDTTAQDTSITSGPASATTLTSATFAFTGTDNISSVDLLKFFCSIDDGAAALCTSPQDYSGLAEGSHTFAVYATDQAGNQDASPASFTWAVDTTAPDTTIDSSTPATSPSKVRTASYSFSGSDGVSSPANLTFRCSLDGAAAAACTSPKAYTTNLSAGSHTFSVYAVDEAGNADASPTSRTWVVDIAAPSTTLIVVPPRFTTSTSASFTVFGSDSVTTMANLTYKCSMDGATATACISPALYTGLSVGSHTFTMAAVDEAGNADATPAERFWTIDVVAPNTSITSGPASSTTQTSATFGFTATDNEAQSAKTFVCSIDGGTAATCTSPKAYSGLAGGSHTFTVTATDQAGNVDASPATSTWQVDVAAPDTSITASPVAFASSDSASFSFTGSDDTTAPSSLLFYCKLDSGARASCSSPKTYSSLSQGTHTVDITALDAAGQEDPTPSSYTWVVDTTAPETSISAAPAAHMTSSSAVIEFDGSDNTSATADLSFACSVDGAAYATCSSGLSLTGLAQGSHTVLVRATDQTGNTDASPASVSFTRHLLPSAPTGVVVTPGGAADPMGSARVAFEPADNGADSATGFTVKCGTGIAADELIAIGSTSPVLVGLLTPESTYSCQVLGTNAFGEGVYSESSATFATTVPNAPTNVTTTMVSPTSVSVTFQPAADVVPPTSQFRVQCDSSTGGIERHLFGAASPLVISSLTPGATYTCRARGDNAYGKGIYSTESALFLIAAMPATPTNVIPTVTGTTASVAFTPGVGGGAATQYMARCTSTNGGLTRNNYGTNTPINVPSLTAGKTYTCVATATNALGTTPLSAPSAEFTVAAPPATPTNVIPTITGTTASVAFTPGVGGGAATQYMARCTSTNGGLTRNNYGTNTPINVPSLTPGKTYTCIATATNALGTTPLSAESAPFTVASMPATPTNVTPTVTGTTASVAFTPGVGGGAATQYMARCTSTNGGLTRNNYGTNTPINVPSLTPGKTYTCIATATNALGTTPLSAESAPFTVV